MIKEIIYQDHSVTISMIKWSEIRKIILWICRSVGLVKRHAIPTPFIPAYEIAVYDGSPDIVPEKSPEVLFYFLNKSIAMNKFSELELCIAEGGALGTPIQNFMQTGDPKTQGVLLINRPEDAYTSLLVRSLK